MVIMVTTSSQIQYPLESHDPATLHPEIEDDAVPSYADAVVQTSLFEAEAAPRPARSASIRSASMVSQLSRRSGSFQNARDTHSRRKRERAFSVHGCVHVQERLFGAERRGERL